MKKEFTIEFKIIFAVAVVLLAMITVGVTRQIFAKNDESTTFVYNSAQAEQAFTINNSDIYE